MTGRLAKRLADERGIALVMAVGILAFMSLTITSMIYFTSTNQRSSSYNKAEFQAIDFAEAGVNNAMAVLFDIRNAPDLDVPTLISTPRTNTYPGGSVTWSGQLTENPTTHQLFWVVTATGKVKNPTGPGQAVKRTLTTRVPLKPPALTRPGLEVWNWIYSHRTGNTCDMSILQSVNLLSPLYVRGNLCMRNGAKIGRGPLIVGGSLDQQNPQTSVGLSSNLLTTDVKIGTGCRWSNSGGASFITPCKAEPWTPSTKVYVAASKLLAGQTVPTDALSYPLELPSVWWATGKSPDGSAGWYEYSSPGPYRPCKTVSGTPPVFDTTTATGAPDGLNNSVPGVFNLTPSLSYTCQSRTGELSWNSVTRTLTIVGTVFIDGSAKVENNGSALRYIGQGVIYLGGTLVIKNTQLCAKVNASGNDCDFANWDPNSTLLIFATYSKGGQISDPTVGTQVVSSSFQGGLYSEWAIDCTTTSKTQGPMVSRQEVRVGQTNENAFPKVTILPIGAPGFGPEFYSAQEPSLG
jgi:hypothetical protein